MSDRLAETIAEALRPLVRELVAEEVERVLDTNTGRAGEEPPYLTVAQYAERHHTSAAAVRARIRRGKLEAIRPPGGREYLIPNEQPGGHAGYPDRSTKCPPRRWSVRGA